MAENKFYFNEYENNIEATWQVLQSEKEYCDVTFSCEDKLILAHKIIVSSVSPILRDILKQHPNPHPLIYLQGTQYKHLESLITYIYQGKVSVDNKDLRNFFQFASDLKIKGLCDDDNGSLIESDNSKMIANLKSVKKVKKFRKRKSFKQRYFDTNDVSGPEKVQNTIESQDHPEDNNLEKPRKIKMLNESNTHQEKEENMRLILKYINSLNEKTKIACSKCNKNYANKSSLNHHQASAHNRVKYSCDQCEYKATHKASVKTHAQSVHEGLRFPCGMCRYIAGYKNDLKKHVLSIHLGQRYPCDQCEYKATDKFYLRRHVKAIHEGIREYPCDQCKYKASDKGHLKRHVKLIHK